MCDKMSEYRSIERWDIFSYRAHLKTTITPRTPVQPSKHSPNPWKSNEKRLCSIQKLCDWVNKTKLLVQFKPLDASCLKTSVLITDTFQLPRLPLSRLPVCLHSVHLVGTLMALLASHITFALSP